MTMKSLPVLLLLGAVTLAHARHDRWEDAATAEETIEKTFSVSPSGTAALDLDNIWGSIEVTGTSGNQIQVHIAKSIRAASPEDLALAQKEVTLDVTQDADSVRLYVNGPFRCCENTFNCGHLAERRYVVKMDFKVRVPERIALKLATVNPHASPLDLRPHVRSDDLDCGARRVKGGFDGQIRLCRIARSVRMRGLRPVSGSSWRRTAALA